LNCVCSKTVDRILQPGPELTKRSTYIFGGIDCCSGGFVVVLCNPESKLFLVVYQVHRFNGTMCMVASGKSVQETDLYGRFYIVMFERPHIEVECSPTPLT
jgi:hypothetical protein